MPSSVAIVIFFVFVNICRSVFVLVIVQSLSFQLIVLKALGITNRFYTQSEG